MRVVIVDREPDFLAPLIGKLESEGFEVAVVENISGVLALIKVKSIHFLVGDSSILVDHSLGSEVHRQYPLARLIVLASRPSILSMVESLTRGITDYLPRHQENFPRLVETILDERDRLVRWQYMLLSDELGKRTLSQ